MATIYIDDTATGGLNDGTSWTNAFTSMRSIATGVAVAGDLVLIANTHNELTGETSFNFYLVGAINNHIVMKSVNKTTGVYTPGASFDTIYTYTTAGAITFYTKYADIYGVTFGNSMVTPGYNSSSPIGTYWEDVTCHAAYGYSTGATIDFYTYGGTHPFRWKNVNFVLNDASQKTRLFKLSGWMGYDVEWNGGSFGAGPVPPNGVGHTQGTAGSLFTSVGVGAHVYKFYINNVDLSGIKNSVFYPDVTVAGSILDFKFTNVAFGPSAVYFDPAFDMSLSSKQSRIEFTNCGFGTLLAAPFQYAHMQPQGKSETTLTQYRTGGANDGQQANGYSQQITAKANMTAKGNNSVHLPLSTYIDTIGAAKTINIYFAHAGVGAGVGGLLQDDQFWVEIVVPSDLVSPTATGKRLESRSGPFNAAPSDIPADAGSVWNGTGLATQQKLSFSYTPTVTGMLTGIIHFAPESATDTIIYVDPGIEVV